jgi:hypothetical protein
MKKIARTLSGLVTVLLFTGSALMIGCPPSADYPSPRPDPATDVDLCGSMCDHLGPKGLNCEEGGPVYDSDLPGPNGVPNESCEDFCKKQENAGSYLNPRCLAKTPTCAEIEIYRSMDCTEKK